MGIDFSYRKALTVFDIIRECWLAAVFVFAFIFLSPAMAANKAQTVLDVTMGLGFTLEEILSKNPEIASFNAASPQPKGIMKISGPMNFHFLYGEDKQLDFKQVKAVIYPVDEFKVEYIHIYPQMDYLKKNDMYAAISLFTAGIVKKGWELNTIIAGADYEEVLIASGKKDYAYYQFDIDRSRNGYQKLQLVLTAIRDLSVSCSSKSSTNLEESECANRLIRVGLYGVY